MVKVQNKRTLEAYNSKRLQRYMLVDLLVNFKDFSYFRGIRRSIQRVYVLKSPHGNKKSGERVERVVYSMKVESMSGVPTHRGAGGVVEKSSSCLVTGSLAAAYAAWKR